MKKMLILFLISIFCFSSFGQTEERKIEVVPTISALGDGHSVSLNTEVVIAGKFKLNKNWNLYGQLGTMYNLYQNKVAEEQFAEWQLGFETMAGIGNNNFRLSGFLNSLSIRDWNTGTMPFVEGGVRFNYVPWQKVWLSIFGTWPISHPVFVNAWDDAYLENDGGLFLINTDNWAMQLSSYGADINLGIGEKFIASLNGFAINENNYQFGAGLQYQLFKNKPWILGGNVFYTNFENENYYYIHNTFLGMLGNDMGGYTFKIGVSNYGGLGNRDFSNVLSRIVQPMYFSPVIKEQRVKITKIGEAFKFAPCRWEGECLVFNGAICITGGKAPYRIFIDWGEGTTEQYTVEGMGSFGIKHIYKKAGELRILISGMDALGKTFSYTGKFIAENCNKTRDCCEDVTAQFDVDKNDIKFGESVNFNWNVVGADQVLFEGKSVEFVVKKYTVTPDTLGTHTYNLRVYKEGKLCKDLAIRVNVTINTPKCPIAFSNVAQGFELPNSSPTTETNWVNNNVTPGPWAFLNKNQDFGSNCTTAQINASIVLIKAGTKYKYYLNVVAGQQLCSYDGKGISHVSYFTCSK